MSSKYDKDDDDDDDDDDENDDEMAGGKNSSSSEPTHGFKEVEIREQDRFLPVANIARIMKKVLPLNAKIAKDSKEST